MSFLPLPADDEPARPGGGSAAEVLERWRDEKWKRLVRETEYTKVREDTGRIPGNVQGWYFDPQTLDDIDPSYRNDPRFEKLAADPAHNDQIRSHSIKEALAILSAERAGLVAAPVMRSPHASLDFFDGKGVPIDVKTPRSPGAGEIWLFDVREPLQSIRNQLTLRADNLETRESQGVVVLLDATYLSDRHFLELEEAMKRELTAEQRSRVIVTSVPEHRLFPDNGSPKHSPNRFSPE